MGREITRTEFTSTDYKDFSARLHDNLEVLKKVLARPDFGRCGHSLGAELEFYLIDRQGAPLPHNANIRQRSGDPHVALELNRYNLEYNFPVYGFDHRPFVQLETDIQAAEWRLNQLAAEEGGSLLAIGILPTLQAHHLGDALMTPEPRYLALSKILMAMRGGTFAIDIQGQDRLELARTDISAEGICTSLQVHFAFPVEEFVDLWNAATLATPVVLAIAANSPLLLGKCLWRESRIPLFKQSTDSRRRDVPWHDLPRVDLTHGWLRHSVYELFAQGVYLYPPLIPICHSEDPVEALAAGNLPGLHELSLHHGTIWHWNRPIYSAEGDGHIRIELRSLPAGPSAIDMAANAAFHIGLALGLKDHVEALLPAIPFRFAVENFYRAARDGMDARLIWPSLNQNRLWDRPVREIAEQLVDIARRGLRLGGIDEDEVERMMQVIERRLETGQSGAEWQLGSFDNLSSRMDAHQALQALVGGYQQYSHANCPVADWELMR